MPHALLVEDDLAQLRALADLVEREGFETSTAGTIEDARACLSRVRPDLVLSDLLLPDGSGLDLLATLEEEPGRSQMVLVTGNATVESAVEALRQGVTDYLTKPVELARLRAVLQQVARTRAYRGEIGQLRGELRRLGRFGVLIGASSAMQSVYALIERVSPTDATVLVTGESGTGKELVAQSIHSLSRRRTGPFLAINCGAVSPSLIETELFGHERGSFTGAAQRHRGYFERASGGTLFLDEITEMPLELQVKLLRVLETGNVMRIGGDQPVAADVRVIAASNRSPKQAVSEGRMREDLYYRLNVFPIALPPLRERTGDISVLAHHFLGHLNETHGTEKRITYAAIDRMERHHHWPGNVRELSNVIHRSFIMAEREIDEAYLPGPVPAQPLELAGANESQGAQLRVGSSISQIERRLILETLTHYQGDKRKAATVLGISLKTLYNRLNVYRAV